MAEPGTLAELLHRLRIRAGITQEELAAAATLSPRTVSDLERGISRKARRDTAGLLAEALGLAGPDREEFLAAARGRPVAGGAERAAVIEGLRSEDSQQAGEYRVVGGLGADGLAAWLIGLLANAGRKKPASFVIGTDQERTLRQAATGAVRRTARELRLGDDEQAEHMALVISQVFSGPVSSAPSTGQATLLEALQAGINRQLAVLDDPSLTGTGQSSADRLGLAGSVVAQKLTDHLVQEIVSRGGPLAPLADQLSHDMTHLQGQRREGVLGQLALPDELRGFGNRLLWILATRATALVDEIFSTGLVRPSRLYGIVDGHFVPTASLVAWMLTAVEHGLVPSALPSDDLELRRRQRVLRTQVSRAFAGDPYLFKEQWLRELAVMCSFSADELEFLLESRAYRGTGVEPAGLRKAIEHSLLRVGGVAAATRNLPRDVPSFTGRELELAHLTAELRGDGASTIHAIDGMPGAGKTAFAVHAAHRLASQFPDGQIFLSLHGHTQGQRPVDPAEALANLLQVSGVPAEQIPSDLKDRRALWRNYAAGKRLLLLLDDAVGSEQVRPLLPGGRGSLVLITSRQRLADLQGATPISLATLPPDEAAILLVKLAGRAGVDPRDPAVLEITRLCGYLPLAIGITARQLLHHPAWSLPAHVAELAAARDRVRLMATEDLSVAAAFNLSYRDLSPGEQQMFRRLGLFPGFDIDAYVAAALGDTSLDIATLQLDGLSSHYLLAEFNAGRYQFHDLIRQDALRLAADDPHPEREAALDRLVGYYLHGLQEADSHLFRRTRVRPLKAAEVPPRHIAELVKREDAIAWMERERANLHAIAVYSARHERPDATIGIAGSMHGFLRSFGHWEQAIALHAAALEAARQARDLFAEADALTDMGAAQHLAGHSAEAAVSLDRALDVYRRLGNSLGEANARTELYAVHVADGDYPAAASNIAVALELYNQLGDELGQANALENLGSIQTLTGDYQQGIESLTRALALYRELGDLFGEAGALNDLGGLQLAAGDHEAAAAALGSALKIYRDSGNEIGQAPVLRNLGALQMATGSPELAAETLSQALQMYVLVGSRLGQAQVLNIMGESLITAEPADARGHHEEALAIATDISSLPEQARALEGIGQSELREGDPATARRSLEGALEIYRQIGSARAGQVEDLISGQAAGSRRESANAGAGPSSDGGERSNRGNTDQSDGREVSEAGGQEGPPPDSWGYGVRPTSGGGSSEPPDGRLPSGVAGTPYQRFLACDVPENVRVASEFLVLVRITEFQQGASVPLIVPDIPVHGARVYIAVDVPPGCEVVTDAVVPITLPRHGDSDEAWFVIRAPNSCGPYQVTVTAVWGHARSQLLAREPFKVQVHDAPTDPMKTRLWPTRPDGTDQDAAVLVVSRISARRYKYVLCRPGHSPVTDDLRMEADPRSKLSRLTSELSQMAKGSPGWRPAGLSDELRARGNDLWRDFLPPLVREALNDLRAGRDKLTISCTNSTLAVPWEMFHPIDSISGQSDFLVQLFDLIRSPESTSTWCSQFALPPAVIVLPDDQLPGALDEARAIGEMLGVADGGPYIREKVQLQRRLRDRPFGLLHFAAHDRDGGGNISLAARQRFSPSDLNEFAGAGGQWSGEHPLVFVNACGTNTSRQIFTQFASWAQRSFEAGAGGFIGSMWDVRSATAGIFAERFYHALYVDGRPFSNALHEAREHSRRENDPTWLAYAAHGDHSATAHSSN